MISVFIPFYKEKFTMKNIVTSTIEEDLYSKIPAPNSIITSLSTRLII